ncbi:MAG TPA: TRAP transporter TatT component family protein [Gammaproteobacteria bacterium]|nr:TRAP transporter TatT component family protein [Gammaproteobacteria bacterium]
MLRKAISGLQVAWLLLLGGCVGNLAGTLSDAILNQSDPETVEAGLPAYLILLDGMIASDPKDEDLLLAGAKLYSAYASAFANSPERAKRLSGRALEYARRAVCAEIEALCSAMSNPPAAYAEAVSALDDEDDAPYLYALGGAWAGWIQAHAESWQAIAELPKVQATIERVLALDEAHDKGGAHLYMGVLLCLRPAALGGQPEAGRKHFERALELSGGKNLMVKVLYAKHYARLVFDRELHDRLLQEVLAAPVEAPGMTLINTLAQEQAKELLASSAEYF